MDNAQIDGMGKIICQSYGDTGCRKTCQYSACFAGIIAEELYNNGYSTQRWISVEDKLPDTLWKDVLAYRKSGKTQVVRYFGGHDGLGYFSDGECYGEAKDLGITHWMELPEPPVEKEKNNE